MKFKTKETRNRVLTWTVVGLTGLLAFSILASCITGALAWHFYSRQRTVTVPMGTDRSFTFDSMGGDARLNALLVRAFVNLRFSVTPETVDAQHAQLLRAVPPEYRSSLKKALAVEAAYIKKNGVSSVFAIDDETYNPADGNTIARGTLSATTSNGRLSLPDVNKALLLHAGYVDGLIRLTAFSEVPWTPLTSPATGGKP